MRAGDVPQAERADVRHAEREHLRRQLRSCRRPSGRSRAPPASAAAGGRSAGPGPAAAATSVSDIGAVVGVEAREHVEPARQRLDEVGSRATSCHRPSARRGGRRAGLAEDGAAGPVGACRTCSRCTGTGCRAPRRRGQLGVHPLRPDLLAERRPQVVDGRLDGPRVRPARSTPTSWCSCFTTRPSTMHGVHVAALGLERHVAVGVEQRERHRRGVVLDQHDVGLLARARAGRGRRGRAPARRRGWPSRRPARRAGGRG